MAMTPELERAIEAALNQARAELIAMYTNNYIGKVEINCGQSRLSVKAMPERVNEPVKFAAN